MDTTDIYIQCITLSLCEFKSFSLGYYDSPLLLDCSKL